MPEGPPTKVTLRQAFRRDVVQDQQVRAIEPLRTDHQQPVEHVPVFTRQEASVRCTAEIRGVRADALEH